MHANRKVAGGGRTVGVFAWPPRIAASDTETTRPLIPSLPLQLGGLVGLAVSLLYFLQEKIVSSAASCAQRLVGAPAAPAAHAGAFVCCSVAA